MKNYNEYIKDHRINQLYIQALKLKQQIISVKDGTEIIILTRDPKFGLKNRKHQPVIWLRLSWG